MNLGPTYHDNEDSDKDSYEVGEKGQGVLNIVHVTVVCLLDDVLSVHHHVTHKHQKPEIQLQIGEGKKVIRRIAEANNEMITEQTGSGN